MPQLFTEGEEELNDRSIIIVDDDPESFFDCVSYVTAPGMSDDDKNELQIISAADVTTPYSGSQLSMDHRSNNTLYADNEYELADQVADLQIRPQEVRKIHTIREPEFVYPLSRYEGYAYSLPITKEKDAVDDLIQKIIYDIGSVNNSAFESDSFTEFELNDFSIYLPGQAMYHGWEMRALQNLTTKLGNQWYCFDGVLSVNGVSRYVQCVPFKVCSIGNYGADADEVGDNIWIQSERNMRENVFYRLKAPSKEYSRYHEGFLWLANLAKHFVDYSEAVTQNGEKVSIHNFGKAFREWLDRTHPHSKAVGRWIAAYKLRDFRPAISANIDFLWKEAVGTLDGLRNAPIWAEVLDKTSIPEQPREEKQTVVTPYVYECFSHLKFGHLLKPVEPVKAVGVYRQEPEQASRLITGNVHVPARSQLLKSDFSHLNRNSGVPGAGAIQEVDIESIKIGDVLGVTKDVQGTTWKDEESKWKIVDHCWYVLVQRIYINKHKERTFDVLWLYRPADTTCALMKYPYHNELFLSDNCNCDSAKIAQDEILCKVRVRWGEVSHDVSNEFFIRQTYLHDNSFVTLQDSQKKCVHLRGGITTDLQDLIDKYRVGDTVLVVPPQRLKSKHELEPCEIVEFLREDGKELVMLRRLFRRRDFDGKPSSLNELVYGDETFTTSPNKIERKCFVRFYTQAQVDSHEVPTPYDRGGTADAYFITSRIIWDGEVPVFQAISDGNVPTSLIQGYDPKMKPPRKAFRGLDLFCGGGNLGRGLEEAGAVHFDWAVDLDKNAIHTYFANLKDPNATQLFLGSVDDMLFQALQGNVRRSPKIPLPGQVECISAGSPCKGYSLLNPKRNNDKGLKNQSLVASVAAYIDFYRPKYAILENVPAMAQKGIGRAEDVLSQLICCLVGMGYQAQLFMLDAWSFGSPQSRSRLFVSIAAPGFNLPPHPELSHSHPASTNDFSLGLMANGKSFGERRWGLAPFEFVTAGEATDDLPDIGDGRTYHCTAYPDHRMSTGITHVLKAQIECIPIVPRAMNFAKTWRSGRMTKAERALFPTISKSNIERQCVQDGSKAWERVHPQKLFPTIATRVSPACARSGRSLHWQQHRLLTVQEVRRAQSIPDDEVLLGTPAEQWKMAGDTVARTVALVVGMSLREAWLHERNHDYADTFTSFQRASMVSAKGPNLPQPLSRRMSILVNETTDTDASVESHQQYRQSLKRKQLSSSVSRETSASISSQSTPDPHKTLKGDMQATSATLSEARGLAPKKRKKLLGPASVRVVEDIWQPYDYEAAYQSDNLGQNLEGTTDLDRLAGTTQTDHFSVQVRQSQGQVKKRGLPDPYIMPEDSGKEDEDDDVVIIAVRKVVKARRHETRR